MFLAETTNFFGFDIFVILFSIIIAIGFFRLIRAEKKNLFAIGFAFIALATFLVLDGLVVANWMGKLS